MPSDTVWTYSEKTNNILTSKDTVCVCVYYFSRYPEWGTSDWEEQIPDHMCAVCSGNLVFRDESVIQATHLCVDNKQTLTSHSDTRANKLMINRCVLE